MLFLIKIHPLFCLAAQRTDIDAARTLGGNPHGHRVTCAAHDGDKILYTFAHSRILPVRHIG